MRNFYVLITALLLSTALFAQDRVELSKKLTSAKTPEDKIKVLDKIATSYMMDGNQDSLAMATGNRMLQIATQSRNKRLITLVNFLNGKRWTNMAGVNDMQHLKWAYSFLNTALNQARQYNFPDIEAQVYLQFASYYRSQRMNNLDKALDYITRAQNILAANPNDSLSIVTSRALADIYFLRGDQIGSFRSLNNALTIADRSDKPTLIADTYRALGDFYASLEDYDKAIDYNQKAYNLLAGKHLLKPGQEAALLQNIADINIGKKNYAEARKYYWMAYTVAKKGKLHQISINKNLFYIEFTYLEEKNTKQLTKYLNDPRLANILTTYKQQYLLDYYRGRMYDWQNKRDSALYYFSKVLAPAEQSAPPTTLIGLYGGYGLSLIKNGETVRGLQVMEKAKNVSIKLNNLGFLSATYQMLDSAYALAGNKSKAYDYRILYDKYKDSLRSQSKARQLTLVEVNAESQRLKLRQQKEEEALRKKHNLQYMGITAAIASAFILLVLLGFFTTTASIIRGFGFFAFIFFFEFISLLFDHAIHEWTHGEPLKIMAIKIVFVAILVPIHHYVEHKVIHHLINRKKIKLGKLVLVRRTAVLEEQH